jgi:regulator of sigma E protease
MLGSILIFLIVLSILILAHEFGHFFMAKRAGVLIEEFGLGLPPRIFGRKLGETIYSINLLPFGGFVKLHGENTEGGVTKPKRAFINKSKGTRSVIIVAGVMMNFALAILAFSIVSTFVGIPKESENVKIVEVIPMSPAQNAELVVGDIVRLVNEERITEISQFVTAVERNKGKETVLTLERNGGRETRVTLTPRAEPPEGQGPIGIVISSTETYFPPLWQRPFIGIYYGFGEALFWGGAIVAGISKIFSELFGGQIPKDLAGPVGIFAITSQAASIGTLALINFIGILSVNLAILNIIPFPALDGGRLLFIGIEALFGRKVVPKVEAVIHTAGMVILLFLLLAITAQDIRRLITYGGISGFIDSILK